ncbi:MAG: hypothetical protein GY710_18670 [Desulfobacteraceae bacterium]|nr:hypothetical protein [Desulfobacteraceae bacterium]
MSNVNFIDNQDKTTFFPFILIDNRDSEWSDVRLSFSDWEWFKEKYGTDTINDYYINGYGIQGLVSASRIAAGVEPFPDGMDPNSEGDTCYFIFEELSVAVETAKLACQMINNLNNIEKMTIAARKNDLEE